MKTDLTLEAAQGAQQMMADMIDWINTVATIIGLLIMVWIAVCVFCLILFTVLVTGDTIQVHRKSRTAKHQRAADDDLAYFDKIVDEEPDWRRRVEDPDVELIVRDSNNQLHDLYQPQSIAERKEMDRKRQMVGYQSRAQPDDATQVYEPVTASTPPAGVMYIAGQEFNTFEDDTPPFNLKESSHADSPRTEPT